MADKIVISNPVTLVKVDYDPVMTFSVNFGEDYEPIALPEPPLNLVATAGNEEVYLTWEAPADGNVNSYNVYAFNASLGELVDSFPTLDPNAIVLGLTNDTTYEFYVTTVYQTMQSTPSNTVTATPELSYPDANILDFELIDRSEYPGENFELIPLEL